MKRSYIVLIIGAGMLFFGSSLGNLIPTLIFTKNPSNSHLITDVNHDLLYLSNMFSIMSQWGIVILVLGAVIFFADRIKSTNHDSRKENDTR